MAGRPKRRARLEAEARAAGVDLPSRRDYRAEMTERLVAQLEAGSAPWQRTWAEGSGGRPFNPISADPGTVARGYSGINRIMLMVAGAEYGDDRWCTRKQADDKGYTLRDGEAGRGTTIEVWKPYQVRARDEDADATSPDAADGSAGGGGRTRMGVRYYTVYNAAQFADFPRIERPGPSWSAVGRAEELVRHSRAKVVHSRSVEIPYYLPSGDYIVVPDMDRFESAEAYYDVVDHELLHWTGHAGRLARDQKGEFGSREYAAEELVAEIGSMFMSAETGIPHNVERHAAYVASWISLLRDDKHAIARAASAASRAMDHVLELDRRERLLEIERERGEERGPDEARDLGDDGERERADAMGLAL